MKGSLRNITGAAGLLVLLALLIVLNVLAGTLRLRADTTAENLYTLSKATKEVLRDLPRDVSLKFYSSRRGEGIPPPVKQYAQRIDDLLREYVAAGAGRITLETIDPQPDSDEEEWAQRYGVAAQRMDPMGEGPGLYLGLVALSGARQVAIPFFAPSDEPQLEYLVTRLIADASVARKPKVGVYSSLPVMGAPAAFMDMGGGSEPWVFISELRNQYQVEQLPGAFADVPADIDTLLLIHPKQLSATVLFALDQFVLRGGKLVAFVDPLSLAEPDSGGGMPSADKASDLNRLTEAWGLKMEPGRVVADPAMATRVRMRDGSADRNRAWLTLRKPYFNQQELATSPLESMMLPMAGYFTGAPVEGLTLAPLITSAEGAGSMAAFEATMGPMAGQSSFKKFEHPVNLALRLTGRFTSAFPEGRPAEANTAETPAASTTPVLKQSEKDGAVVLVADADLLVDDFSVQRINLLGRSVYQLANDNVNFVANLVGQLCGGDQLIALRSRGTYDRPFERVLDLQKDAQERWRQEELKLQDQLQATQMKLSELESAKDPSQQYVITPEQRQEVEQFRAQAAETRRQLKEVRKNLRQEIEQLGLWVKGINMAAVPALVVLFGLAHGWRRRRRAGQT